MEKKVVLGGRIGRMKLYLVRHGETDWNKSKKIQGQVDIPLAPKGIEQAEMTSEGMKDIPFDHIFSSPLKRAYKTAQVVRRDRPIEIVRDDRLKEMKFWNVRRKDQSGK